MNVYKNRRGASTQRAGRSNQGYTKERWAFAKPETMPTAKSKMDASRVKARQAEEEEYMGQPPDGKNLLQARLVLPGKLMIPRTMDEPEAFHTIRRELKVYITRAKYNVLDIRCANIAGLRDAVIQINDAISDMRRSNECPTIEFLVQRPPKDLLSNTVVFKLGVRPYFSAKSRISNVHDQAMDNHLPKLCSDMAASAKALMMVNKDLKMRVNFGLLRIAKRKKGLPQDLSFDEFAKSLEIYSVRRCADLGMRLENVNDAENIAQYLLDPDQKDCCSREDVKYAGEISVVTQGLVLKSTVTKIDSPRPNYSTFRAIRTEYSNRVDWVVAAPNMKFDWNFVISACDKVPELPPGFDVLNKKLILANRKAIDDDDEARRVIQLPLLDTSRLDELGNRIDEIRLKSSVLISHLSSALVIEISITQVWVRGKIKEGPDWGFWGIEVYGLNWDECMNHTGAGELRRDWGEGLINVWPEPDSHPFEARFGTFIRNILRIQNLLEGSAWGD